MRENVLDLFELITGLRMNHAYIRPGGVAQDMPPGAPGGDPRVPAHRRPSWSDDLRTLIDANPVFIGRTKGIAYLDLQGCMSLGVTGPMLRVDRAAVGPAQVPAVLRLRDLRVRRARADTCDAYGRYLVRMDEIDQSLRIVAQCVDRLAERERAPATTR